MTQNIQEASTVAVCSSEEADGRGTECAIQSHGGTGLFQRQLSAAGLADIAEKIAAGTTLDFEDAARLSRSSLPLLGRIVQMRPLPVEWTSDGAEMPVERVANLADLPRQIAQPLAEWETYCRQLIAMREELGTSSEPVAWYPKVNRTPDENASLDDDYTGVEVLRAIALARLLLPESVQIVAPLATLGPKLAQVALDFGATHLGYVSRDGQPLENPLAVNVDELKELQRSCSLTVMKEDS
jgi:hypothetical protein